MCTCYMQLLEEYCSSRTVQVPSWDLDVKQGQHFSTYMQRGWFFQYLNTSICHYFLKEMKWFTRSETQVLYILGLCQRENFGYKIPIQHLTFANTCLSKFLSLGTGFWKQTSKQNCLALLWAELKQSQNAPELREVWNSNLHFETGTVF